MKKIILIIIIIIIGWFAWSLISGHRHNLEPLYTEPYIVVYGRDACGLTRQLMQNLDKQGIYYIYKNIDLNSVADELHSRMKKAGLNTKRYGLPVVDVNSVIFIRPEIDTVFKRYLTIKGDYGAS